MTADPRYTAAQSAIQARRELIEDGTAGPWHDAPEDGDVWGAGNRERICRTSSYTYEQDAALIVAATNAFASDTDALAAVLDRHAPDADYGARWCAHCTYVDVDSDQSWPCPDARSALVAIGIEVE